ncbi:MAG: hypothetical protein PHW00_00400 [Clostridia bacterium]|nr:hypothetical protein [Clostridia bacterium]
MTKKRIALVLAIVMVLSASLCLLTGCNNDKNIYIGIKTTDGIIPINKQELEYNDSVAVLLCLYKVDKEGAINEYVSEGEITYAVSLNRNTMISQTISGASVTFTSIWEADEGKFIKRTGTDTLATVTASIAGEIVATDVILVSLLDNTFALITPTDTSGYVKTFTGEGETKQLAFEVSDRIGKAAYTFDIKTLKSGSGETILRARYTGEDEAIYKLYYEGKRAEVATYISISNTGLVTALKPCTVEVSVSLYDAYVKPLISDSQRACSHTIQEDDAVVSAWSETGVCSVCDLVCIHDYPADPADDTVCGICGLAYLDFIADPIDPECIHETWINGRCQNCGVYQYHYEKGHLIETVADSEVFDKVCTHTDEDSNSTWVRGTSISQCSQCDRVCRHLAQDGYTSLIPNGELTCPVCGWTARFSQSISISILAENALPELVVNSKPTYYNAEQGCWMIDISTIPADSRVAIGEFAIQVGATTYSIGNTITDYSFTYTIDGLIDCVPPVKSLNKNIRNILLLQPITVDNVNFGTNNYFDVVITVTPVRSEGLDPFVFADGDNQIKIRFIKHTSLEITNRATSYRNSNIWEWILSDFDHDLPQHIGKFSYLVNGTAYTIGSGIDTFTFTYSVANIITCANDSEGNISFALTQSFKDKLDAHDYSDFSNNRGYIDVSVKISNTRSAGNPIMIASESSRIIIIRLYLTTPD